MVILPPDTHINMNVYGELILQLGNFISQSVNVDSILIRIKFFGQRDGIIMISQNGKHGGEYFNMQKYQIKCPIQQFRQYLEDGTNLVIDIIDRRNSKLIGTTLVRWSLYLKELKNDDISPILELNSDFQVFKHQARSLKAPEGIGYLHINIKCTFIQKKKDIIHAPSNPQLSQLLPERIRYYDQEQYKVNNPSQSPNRGVSNSPQSHLPQRHVPHVQNQQHVIDENLAKSMGPRPSSQSQERQIQGLPSVFTVRMDKHRQRESQVVTSPHKQEPLNNFSRIFDQKKEKSVEKKEQKSYINPMEQLELELLKLEDDHALLFGQPQQKQGLPEVEQVFFEKENDINTLNIRSIDSITVIVQKLNMLNTLGDKIRQKIKDKTVTIECRVPMVRQGMIAYQTFLIHDTNRSALSIFFNSQLKSFLEVNDRTWGELNQCTLTFRVFFQELQNFELGVGEFRLQTMIIDGLKNFTYEIDIQQTRYNQKKIKELVTVALLTVTLQLGSDQRVVESKKERNMEDQIQKLKQEIQDQLENERLKLDQERQMNELELNNQIQTMQLFMQVDRVQHLNQMVQPTNLQIKCKHFGLDEDKVESEVFWNIPLAQFDFRLISPINLDILRKMQFTYWVIELWNNLSSSEEPSQVIGVVKLSLAQLYSSIFDTNSPTGYIKFIKTNLYPVIIYDNDLPVDNLRTKETMAILKIRLAFGTFQQISRYQQMITPAPISKQPEARGGNEEQKEQSQSIQEPESQQPSQRLPTGEEEQIVEKTEEQEESEQMYQIPFSQALIIVLNQIVQTPIHLPQLPKEQYIGQEQAFNVISQLCSKSIDLQNIYVVCFHLFDKSKQLVNWGYFLDSWTAFQFYRNIIIDQFTKIYQQFYTEVIRSGAYQSINQFERLFTNGNVLQFGQIDREQLREILYQINVPGRTMPSGPTLSPILIEQVLKTLEQQENQVFIYTMFDFIRQVEIFGEIRQMQIQMNFLIQSVEEKIRQWLQQQESKDLVERVRNNRREDQSTQLDSMNIILIFQELDLSISLIDALTMLKSISNNHFVESDKGEIKCPELVFWKYINDLSYQQEKHQEDIQEVEEVAQILSQQESQFKEESNQEPLAESLIRSQIVVQPQLQLEEHNYKIKITLKFIEWMKPFQLRCDQFSINVQVDKDRFMNEIPELNSQRYNTNVLKNIQNINIELDYKIRCDEELLKQIGQGNLLFRLDYFFKNEVVGQFKGSLPVSGILEDGIEGDIALNNVNTNQVTCTVYLQATISKDFDIIDRDDLSSASKPNPQYRYYLRILEVIVMNFRQSQESDLGEIYFQVQNPFQQSPSYSLPFLETQLINTNDCVLQLLDQPSTSEIQIRSLLLGEDKLIGHFEIDAHQLIDQLKAESNYITIFLEDTFEAVTFRIGVKLICLNFDQNSLNEQSLMSIFKIFDAENLINVNKQINIEDNPENQIKRFFRQELKLTFSEISMLINLMDNDKLQQQIVEIFTEQIYKYNFKFLLLLRIDESVKDHIKTLLPNNSELLKEILNEFVFYDKSFSGFIDPKYTFKILGFYNFDTTDETLKTLVNYFIPNTRDIVLIDKQLEQTKKSNQFDYLSFLRFVQHITASNSRFTPLLKVNSEGPIQHEVRRALEKLSPSKQFIQEDIIENFQEQFQHPIPEEPQQPPPPSKPQLPRPTYQSSEESSQTNPIPKEKTSSSGTRLQQIQEKLPDTYKDPNYIKRIEEIMKRNHLNVDRFDQISSDDDSDSDGE